MRLIAVMAIAALAGCGAGPAQPVAIDTVNDSCAECRMLITDARLAAQIVASGEEPRLFDDIGCLRAYAKAHPLARGDAIYVADHRTGAWVPAGAAVYTQTTSRATPMASGILAHADAASRERDAAAAGGEPLGLTDILRLAATGAVP
jgi:copper chaperone NosL